MTKNTKSKERTIPLEFTERMANLFLVCIDGLRSQIPNDDRLYMNLDKLHQVINKVVSRRKVTDLGQEIEAHFKGKTLEKDFQKSEKQATKNILLGIIHTLKEVETDVGSYDHTLDECIGDIAAANDLKDILAIKDKVFNAVKKSKSKTQANKRDLQISQNAFLKLSKKLVETQSNSVVDPLTKILNKSAYDMVIVQAIHDFQRTKNPVCLMVCNIDNFKNFNDTYGQRAADKVLCSTATNLEDYVKNSGQIFRYGGKVFVVLLHNTPSDNAVKLAGKICSKVKRDFFVFKEKKLKVTISLGVTFLQEGDTDTSVFERADKALYEAKRKGKGCVEVSPV